MRAAIVFNYLVEATLIGSAVMLGVMAVRFLLRRQLGSRVTRALWLLAALRLLLPIALPNPLMNAIKPTLSVDAGIRPMADQVRTRVGDAATALYWKALGGSGSPTLLEALQRVARAAGNGQLSWLVLLAYLLGAVGVAGWIITANVRFRRQLALRKPSAELSALWESVCAGCGLKKTPGIMAAEGAASVCVLGYFRPCVAVSSDAPRDALPDMLRHACAQVRLRTGFWSLIRHLCLCAHWFNPLVWVSAYLSRLDDTLACDAVALAPLDRQQRESYASWLIHQKDTPCASPNLLTVASCMTVSARTLALRIRQALHPRPAHPAALGTVCLAAALTLSIMFATAEQSSSEYIPLLTTPPVGQAGDDLTTQAGAEAYARRFAALEGISVGAVGEYALAVQTEEGWQVSLYMPSGESCEVFFDREGTLTYYMDSSVTVTALHPLAEPITIETAEGRAWCAFLAGFLERHVPAVYEAFEVMEIAGSGRVDGDEYLTVHLLDGEGRLLGTVDIQAAPQGRIYRYMWMEHGQEI